MAGVYEPGNISGIASAMNERYQSGETYDYQLPWDVARHEELHKAVARLATDCPIPGPHAKVVDVGCGMRPASTRPYLIPFLRTRRVSSLDVVLTDISDKAIEHIRGSIAPDQWADKMEVRNHFLAAPAELLQEHPICRDADLVVSVESIEHWSDVEAGLRSIHEILKKGGTLVLTTPNRDSLHVQMARRLGVEVPFCSSDHTYEFGFEELDRIVEKFGFVRSGSVGVGFAPYWALEGVIGSTIRHLTDYDHEVVSMLNQIGRSCPEYSFCQAKSYFKRLPCSPASASTTPAPSWAPSARWLPASGGPSTSWA